MSDESSKAGGLIVNAFGGASVITGDDLTALMAKDYVDAAELLKAASE